MRQRRAGLRTVGANEKAHLIRASLMSRTKCLELHLEKEKKREGQRYCCRPLRRFRGSWKIIRERTRRRKGSRLYGGFLSLISGLLVLDNLSEHTDSRLTKRRRNLPMNRSLQMNRFHNCVVSSQLSQVLVPYQLPESFFPTTRGIPCLQQRSTLSCPQNIERTLLIFYPLFS